VGFTSGPFGEVYSARARGVSKPQKRSSALRRGDFARMTILAFSFVVTS
jgi:hypothetical protein